MILLKGGGACMVAPRGGRGRAGGHVWLLPGGGMHGFCWGACIVFAGGCAWFLLGGHAWFLQGGHAWFLPGVCVVFARGACVVFARGGMHRIRRDMVNEWVVCILLECILVFICFHCIPVMIFSGNIFFQTVS